MKPISNNLAKVITKMTKADALAPIVALEATVVTGRTYEAYKRGHGDEARERFCEETMGSITWLCGVKYLNKLGDKILEHILKNNGKSFDVGTDNVLRRPFDNFVKNEKPKFTSKQVALMKGAKVLSSIVLANLFIGFIVPKANQALTRKLRHDRKAHHQQNTVTLNNPSFKGGPICAINKFTNAIENTNTGQLLSSDAGIAGGRIYNARSDEERREIFIRDIGSIYFYMWAQGHVRKGLNYIQTGHSKRLNPTTANIFTEHLNKVVKNDNLSVGQFRQLVLGKNDAEIVLPKGMKFESQKLSSTQKFFKEKPLEVIKLSETEKFFTDKQILQRLKAMSELQPKRLGESVLTKQQVVDAINISEINNPELLHNVFNEFTGGKAPKTGDYINEYKYISNKKLYNLKKEMAIYTDMICKEAKGGKINKEFLEKVKNKNLKYSGWNFAGGFAVAALFLGTLIPKFQYYVTRKTTGVDAFPGVYDFKNHKEVDD